MSDIELENIAYEKPQEENNDINFNGSWENKNRSITAAAVTGLIGIGVIYFNAQSILMMVFAAVYKAIYDINIPSNYIDKMKAISVQLKTPALIALVLSEFIFMLLPTLWIVKKWHTKEVRKYLRVQNFSVKETSLAILITFFLLPLSYYLSYSILQKFKMPEIFKTLGSQLFSANSTAQFVVIIFVVAVTPAICEEVFFRGYFQRTLERALGTKSFIITGILFGLFHMQPLSLISLSILGLLFSYFYYRSRSIFPSSAAHFTNNFFAVLFLYIQSIKINFNINSDGSIPLIMVAASFLVAAWLFMIYLKITKNVSAARL